MGKSIDALIRNASDAMRDWAEVVLEKGGRVPEPRPLETLRKAPEVAEAIG